MFATYEEALELQIHCQFCGKPKQSIFGHYKIDEPTFYTLEKCDLSPEECDLHCFGHENVIVELATNANDQSDLINAAQFNGW